MGPRANQGTVKVAVFTRQLGQLVSHEFVVDKGNVIGQSITKNLKNPPPSTIVEAVVAKPAAGAKPVDSPAYSEKKVDFSTGAVVVDVNFGKRIFRTGQEVKTTELVYLDAEGRLRSCLWIKNMSRESRQKTRYDKLKNEVEALAAEAARAAAAGTGDTPRR